MAQENIFPIHEKMLSQADKESLLGQRGMVFWLTGLSGAGKSTLAVQAERLLHAQGVLVKLLDGDNIRQGLNANLGFSMADRQENIRRIAEVARLFQATGIVTICTFICPTQAIRALAKDIIGPEHFREIYIQADVATCESRDPKGLYRKARAGEITNFTGVQSPYEVPQAPDLSIPTATRSVQEAATQLTAYIRTEIAAPRSAKTR